MIEKLPEKYLEAAGMVIKDPPTMHDYSEALNFLTLGKKINELITSHNLLLEALAEFTKSKDV